MNVDNEKIQEAVRNVRMLETSWYQSDHDKKEVALLEYLSAKNILDIIGVNADDTSQKGHCPVCGIYLGKKVPDDDTDPECVICGWMGKI